MNDNNNQFNEFNYRTKRIDYENHSNQKILLNFEIKSEKKINEKINSNSTEDEFVNNNQNNINIDSPNIFNDNVPNKYPNFRSFLQLKPKEDIEIPTIKYYNFIFNIGSPSN